MKEKFQRVARHLYRREYKSAAGGTTALFYARFKCRLKSKARFIPLGSSLDGAKDKLKELEYQDSKRYDFDLDPEYIVRKLEPIEPEPKPRDGKNEPFTFSEWAVKFPTFDDVKRKRSLTDDLRMIRLHLEPFFGSMLLTAIERETLSRYIDKRMNSTIIRCGEPSAAKVGRGTVSNELSLFRRMLRVGAREGFKVSIPSFEDLIVRTERGGREITQDEQEKLLPVFAPWMRRLWEFGKETCLSQGDLLRLTDAMIDERLGVIKPEGGRKKSGVRQVSPLTPKARAVLDEIKNERRNRAVVPLNGLVFTRDDGRPITKDMIHAQVEKAIKETGVKKFVFHNLRNTALTEWARSGIDVDIAMKAAGHSSVQMHKRYVDLKDADVANAFGTVKNS